MMRILPSVGLAAFLVLPSCGGDDNAGALALDVHEVSRGDLRITVREQGEIQAAQNTRVASQLEGGSTLIYLIPEGTVVAKGDKLAELDVSNIKDKLANQAISVAKAAAALDQAKKNFEIMENSLEAARTAAESRLKIAQMRNEKFVGQALTAARAQSGGSSVGTNREMVEKLGELLDSEFQENDSAEVNYSELLNQVMDLMGEESVDLEMGEMANQILQKIDEISLARADLKLAEDKVHHSRNLYEKLFITKNELDSDEISWKRQLSRVTLAWNDLELLIKYTLHETKITLEQDVRNAELDLDSVIANNEATRVREEAELISNEAEKDLASERLESYTNQIAASVITAPTPGLVVYAQEGGGRGRQPVEEGAQIRERQAIINLPDVTRMVAELKVHEAQVDKVVRGQRAVIKVDAFPERGFVGTVTNVSALPDSSARFSNNDLKVYKTTVTLDGENADQALRPGMNATIEILVGVVPNVLSVPLPGVQHQGSVAYCWKLTPAGPEAVRVVMGQNNLSHVEILEGLEEGDRIFLGVPPGAETPEFEQPKDVLTVEEAIGDDSGAVVQAGMQLVPGDGEGRRRGGRGGRSGRGGRGGGGGANAEFLNQLRAFLIEEMPDRAAELEDQATWFGLLRDPEFQSTVEAVLQATDLFEPWQSYKEAMSGRGRGGGRGRGRDGGDRGGDRSGR